MTWLPVIFLAVTFGAFLQPTNGSAEKKKMLFQNHDIMEYFTQNVIDSLIRNELLKPDQEQDAIDGLKEVIENNQGKKVSKIKHAFAAKLSEIIVENLEGNSEVSEYIDIAIDAIASACKESVGIIDETFIETIRDMVSVLYNNDIEDEIEEEEEKIAKNVNEPLIIQQPEIPSQTKEQITKTTKKTTTTTNQNTNQNEIEALYNKRYTSNANQEIANINEEYIETDKDKYAQSTANTAIIDNTEERFYEESQSKASSSQQGILKYEGSSSTDYAVQEESYSEGRNNEITNQDTTITSTSEESTTSQESSAYQAVAVNYQTVQNTVSSTLQTSDAFSYISTGILTLSDLVSAVTLGLTSHGVQSSTAQSVANQYIASLGVDASSQTYRSAISSAVTQAVQQSGAVTAGQETSTSLSIARYIIKNLSLFISQRSRPAPTSRPVPRPAPRPLPRPIPAPVPAVQQQSSVYAASQTQASNQIAAQSSAVQISQFSGASKESSSSQLSSTSQTSNASQTVAVNYQTVQNSVSSTLQTSDAFSYISTGILTLSDLVSAVTLGLTSHGVQSSTAQSVANQYIASLGVDASSQTYRSAISSAVTQAVQQSGAVTAGQETSTSLSIARYIIKNLSLFISQRSRPAPASRPVPRPAPRPLPRPIPAPVPAVQQQSPVYAASQTQASNQITAQSSAVQTSQFSGASEESSSSQLRSMNAGSQTSSVNGIFEHAAATSHVDQSSIASNFKNVDSVVSDISSFSDGNFENEISDFSSSNSKSSSAVSKTSSQLISAAASERISSLSNSLASVLSSGSVNYSSLSEALASVADQIRNNSNLSQSEIVTEALMETLIALLNAMSPTASDPNVLASSMAQSLIRVFG